MQRDMDLVRQILLKIDEYPEERLPSQPLVSGWHDKQVNYHLKLLREAGLIEAIVFEGSGQQSFANISMTWSGHEFLDLAREESRWEKAKARLGGALNSTTLAVLQEVLVSLAKSAAGLS